MSPAGVIALIVALLVAVLVLRLLFVFVVGRAVGRQALAQQPDRIGLVETNPQAWKDPAAADRLTEPLLLLGYEKAGMFTVAEMPGVVLRLLVHMRESVLAMVYEHPVAGQWVELVTRYADGTTCAVTSCADHGLAPRPGHPVTFLPGTDPAGLHARLLASRPQGAMLPIESAQAAQAFADGFAEAMAWRKAQGVSRGEVLKVAVRWSVKRRAA